MTLRFLSKVVPLALLFASGTWAQFDMAACPADWEWSQNSLSQDPCTIGSMMDASCRGLALYNYPPLNASQYYLPPRKDHSGDLDCDCNTVMYSLYMACALCQGGMVYPWTQWIAACDQVFVTQYPKDIAQGTAVPHWAYYNVTLLPNQSFNETTAMDVGRNPEELPIEIDTTSSSTPGKPTSSISLSSTSRPNPTGASDNSDDGSGKTNVGAIVGGVVGSVVPLTILAVVVFLYMRHRQQKEAERRQVQNPDGLDPYKLRPTSEYGPPMTSVPFAPYNPSDPLTFPPQSPQSSVTYTNPIHNTRGTYSGMPEV